MTRGGARTRREAPERRCVVTGERGGKEGLIRFALDPDGVVTPDLAERLPGRGVWVGARRDLVARAVTKRLFARGFKQAATAPADLPDRLAEALARRLIEAVGLARRAGLAICGFDTVRARLRAGPVGLLLQARDGSPDQRGKLRGLAGEAPVIAVLDAAELGLAFGRESVIHACFDAGGATDGVLREARRAAGFRDAEIGAQASDGISAAGTTAQDEGRDGRGLAKDGS